MTTQKRFIPRSPAVPSFVNFEQFNGWESLAQVSYRKHGTAPACLDVDLDGRSLNCPELLPLGRNQLELLEVALVAWKQRPARCCAIDENLVDEHTPSLAFFPQVGRGVALRVRWDDSNCLASVRLQADISLCHSNAIFPWGLGPSEDTITNDVTSPWYFLA